MSRRTPPTPPTSSGRARARASNRYSGSCGSGVPGVTGHAAATPQERSRGSTVGIPVIASPPDVQPLLSVRGVAKSYGSVVALRSADLTVRSGECHALLGANGAGKSTLVKILTGVIRSDAGEIHIAGARSAPSSPATAYAIGLAPVFQ